MITAVSYWYLLYNITTRQTLRSLSYLSAERMNLPSSSCISLFSSKLFRTGSTFLSAFSTPSTTSTRPNKAALTAGYTESRTAFIVPHTFQKKTEEHRGKNWRKPGQQENWRFTTRIQLHSSSLMHCLIMSKFLLVHKTKLEVTRCTYIPDPHNAQCHPQSPSSA